MREGFIITRQVMNEIPEGLSGTITSWVSSFDTVLKMYKNKSTIALQKVIARNWIEEPSRERNSITGRVPGDEMLFKVLGVGDAGRGLGRLAPPSTVRNGG